MLMSIKYHRLIKFYPMIEKKRADLKKKIKLR